MNTRGDRLRSFEFDEIAESYSAFAFHKIMQKILPAGIANRFVTNIDRAIDDSVASDSLVMISHALLQRLSRLKKRSTSIRSVLSWYSSSVDVVIVKKGACSDGIKLLLSAGKISYAC